jgi:hypothetical protein
MLTLQKNLHKPAQILRKDDVICKIVDGSLLLRAKMLTLQNGA